MTTPPLLPVGSTPSTPDVTPRTAGDRPVSPAEKRRDVATRSRLSTSPVPRGTSLSSPALPIASREMLRRAMYFREQRVVYGDDGPFSHHVCILFQYRADPPPPFPTTTTTTAEAFPLGGSRLPSPLRSCNDTQDPQSSDFLRSSSPRSLSRSPSSFAGVDPAGPSRTRHDGQREETSFQVRGMEHVLCSGGGMLWAVVNVYPPSPPPDLPSSSFLHREPPEGEWQFGVHLLPRPSSNAARIEDPFSGLAASVVPDCWLTATEVARFVAEPRTSDATAWVEDPPRHSPSSSSFSPSPPLPKGVACDEGVADPSPSRTPPHDKDDEDPQRRCPSPFSTAALPITAMDTLAMILASTILWDTIDATTAVREPTDASPPPPPAFPLLESSRRMCQAAVGLAPAVVPLTRPSRRIQIMTLMDDRLLDTAAGQGEEGCCGADTSAPSSPTVFGTLLPFHGQGKRVEKTAEEAFQDGTVHKRHRREHTEDDAKHSPTPSRTTPRCRTKGEEEKRLDLPTGGIHHGRWAIVQRVLCRFSALSSAAPSRSGRDLLPRLFDPSSYPPTRVAREHAKDNDREEEKEEKEEEKEEEGVVPSSNWRWSSSEGTPQSRLPSVAEKMDPEGRQDSHKACVEAFLQKSTMAVDGSALSLPKTTGSRVCVGVSPPPLRKGWRKVGGPLPVPNFTHLLDTATAPVPMAAAVHLSNEKEKQENEFQLFSTALSPFFFTADGMPIWMQSPFPSAASSSRSPPLLSRARIPSSSSSSPARAEWDFSISVASTKWIIEKLFREEKEAGKGVDAPHEVHHPFSTVLSSQRLRFFCCS